MIKNKFYIENIISLHRYMYARLPHGQEKLRKMTKVRKSLVKMGGFCEKSEKNQEFFF